MNLIFYKISIAFSITVSALLFTAYFISSLPIYALLGSLNLGWGIFLIVDYAHELVKVSKN